MTFTSSSGGIRQTCPGGIGSGMSELDHRKKMVQNVGCHLAIYKWYISGIYCQLGDYISPTTYQVNQKQPLNHRIHGTGIYLPANLP